LASQTDSPAEVDVLTWKLALALVLPPSLSRRWTVKVYVPVWRPVRVTLPVVVPAAVWTGSQLGRVVVVDAVGPVSEQVGPF
jgi:hypothetical protein